jgi:hypothetical protein
LALIEAITRTDHRYPQAQGCGYRYTTLGATAGDHRADESRRPLAKA